jgi:tetratricopeptide (TPR) repeat protein
VYWDKLLSIDPNNSEALYGKVFALLKMSQLDEAMKNFDNVLAFDRNTIEALLGKGHAYLYESKRKEAVRYFDKILAINPNNVDALGAKKLVLDKQEADTPLDISLTPNFTIAPNKVINKMT